MENSIYKLIKIRYTDDEPQYPEFDISYATLGYFSSVANAEQAMKNEIEECGNSYTFGFLLKEYGLDYLKYASTKSERSYLYDGSFWDETYYILHLDGTEEFCGRPEEKIRFKPGDIVLRIYPLRAVLQIIKRTPPTIEQVNRIGDCCGDQYFTIPHNATLDKGGCTQDHAEGINLFPPRFPVSDELQKKLKEVYKGIQKVTFRKEISENE